MYRKETPGTGELRFIGTYIEQGECRKAKGHGDEQEDTEANMGCGGQSRVLERLCDAHAPFHGHSTTQEERSQAKEDHAGTKNFAENLRGFACLPA